MQEKGSAFGMFDDAGIQGGSSRRVAVESVCEAQDEFGYAFDGQERIQPPSLPEFAPPAVPSHLVTNVKLAILESVQECGSESAEEQELQEDNVSANRFGPML